MVIIPPRNEVFYFVDGEVKMPGRQPWVGELTVTQAIESVGGFSDDARMPRRVLLVRANGTKVVVDCKKAREDARWDPKVFPGDKITVPRL